MQNDCITAKRRRNNWKLNAEKLATLKAGVCINDLIEKGLVTLNLKSSGHCYRLEGKFILRTFQSVCKLSRKNTSDIDTIGLREICNRLALDFKVRYSEDLVKAALIVLKNYTWIRANYSVQESGHDAEVVLQELAETYPDYSDFIIPSSQPSRSSLLENGFPENIQGAQTLPA